MPSTKPRLAARCAHYELVKVGSNWKCVACGEILTITESIQNLLEMSDVLRSAMDNKRTLSESLDEMLGRKEWEVIRDGITLAKKRSRKQRRA